MYFIRNWVSNMRVYVVIKFPLGLKLRSANMWIFIYLKSSFTWMFIWTQFIDQLPVGLLAQLVERCTSIAEVMGSHPVQAWNFFQVLFTTIHFSSVLCCEDLLISSNYILFNTKIAILKYSRELWFCPLAVYWKSPPHFLPPYPPSPLPPFPSFFDSNTDNQLLSFLSSALFGLNNGLLA